MCEICKAKNQKLYTNTIHKRNVEPITLKLCFQHDVELFKRGQEFFLIKYKRELTPLLSGAISLEEQVNNISDLNFA